MAFTEGGEAAVGFGGKLGHLARPLASFGGEASGGIREVGHALHGIHAAAELLPGPLGLAAAAAIVAGVALWEMHNKAKEALMKASHKLAEEIYKAEAAKAKASGGNGDEKKPSAKDEKGGVNVVDAEVVDDAGKKD